jgi:hypothetical protein
VAVDPQPPGRIKDIRVYRDAFIGMAILACTPFLIFGAVEVYGWPAAFGLLLVWVILLVQGCRWFMAFPRRVIFLGLASMGVWLAVVLIAS